MSIIAYKCPNCGGPLAFNADTQNWKCEFCLSDFNEEAMMSFADKTKDTEFEDKARAYSCTSCGAEIVTDDTTAATFCYYCHSPAILPSQLSGDYKPAKVIPFKFKKEAATEAFIKWCKKKPLLSKKFTAHSQLELLSGIYIPFWLFDCDIKGQLAADARNVRVWTMGNKQYTETKYYDVIRSATAKFNGIPADGSKKADDKLMETLEPYDYRQMKDFSMSYLSGYLAQKYDVSQKEVYGRIVERIQKYSSSLLKDTIQGYSSVNVKSCNIELKHCEAAYVLLPVWMFTYQYNDKMYIFAMNGQTGKIAGTLPISKGRAAAWFTIISAVVFVILLVGGLFL